MSSDYQIGQAWTEHRPYLLDLAFRMLGDIGAAEDVVQEAFFRLVQTPLGGVDDARGWVIVVTNRLCLDHIKSAPWRRERPADMAARGYRDADSAAVDPADRVTLDDELRLALLVVLERLTPAERVAFVLHDVFPVAVRARRRHGRQAGDCVPAAGQPGTPQDPRLPRCRTCSRRTSRASGNHPQIHRGVRQW
jgi:RNA polymerase sigma factor (sigma-70 family)